MKKKLLIVTAVIVIISAAQANAQSWSLTGNAGTDPALNFIGTTDNKAFKIRTNNNVRIQIGATGNVKIGSGVAATKLDVNGVITATGGNSDNWNSAFGWGDHAAAGYLTSFTEIDPQVGAVVTSRVPRWSGTALVDGSIFDNGTRVGIGTAAPLFTLHATSSTELRTVYIDNSTNSASTTFGIYGLASGTGAGDKRGGSFEALNGTGTNIGIRSFASGGTLNYAAYFAAGDVYSAGNVGIGDATPASKLNVTGSSTSASVPNVDISENAAATDVDVIGLRSTCIMNPGWGYGLYGTGGYVGVRGIANSTTYTGTAYGVYGSATGTVGTRIGVFGSATGGAENWGGYFSTKTYTNELRVATFGGATGYVLCVGGKAIAEEIRVELEASWPDYVFEKDHNLMNLDELENFITENKHLPNMPSACEIEENGHHLGAVQVKLVEKTEENTLYILELKNQIEKLQARISELEKK